MSNHNGDKNPNRRRTFHDISRDRQVELIAILETHLGRYAKENLPDAKSEFENAAQELQLSFEQARLLSPTEIGILKVEIIGLAKLAAVLDQIGSYPSTMNKVRKILLEGSGDDEAITKFFNTLEVLKSEKNWSLILADRLGALENKLNERSPQALNYNLAAKSLVAEARVIWRKVTSKDAPQAVGDKDHPFAQFVQAIFGCLFAERPKGVPSARSYLR